MTEDWTVIEKVPNVIVPWPLTKSPPPSQDLPAELLPTVSTSKTTEKEKWTELQKS